MNANDNLNPAVEYNHHTIWTPELIEIDLPLAGVGRRLIAMLVDQVIIGLSLGAVWVALVIGVGINAPQIGKEGAVALVVFAGVLILGTLLAYMLYFSGFHAFNNGRTPGKIMCKTRLVTDRGGKPNIGTCVIRSLFDLVDYMLFYYAVSLMMILMTEREKRIADFAAGTIVILDKDGSIAP